MRLLILALVVGVASGSASAQVYVHGYTTKNGTYVAPHYRSSPDRNPYNNWSTVGNVNPYTGQLGTKNPYSSPATPSYNPYATYSNPYSAPAQPTPKCILSTPC